MRITGWRASGLIKEKSTVVPGMYMAVSWSNPHKLASHKQLFAGGINV